MRRFFADRSEHIGDPECFKTPVSTLLNPRYLTSLRESIDPAHAKSSVMDQIERDYDHLRLSPDLVELRNIALVGSLIVASAMRRPGKPSRIAEIVAAISRGWWA